MENEDREVFRMVNDHRAGETVGIIIPIEEAREYAAWKRWREEELRHREMMDRVVGFLLTAAAAAAVVILAVL